MIAFDRAAYPELRQLLGSYLNADVVADYGSIGAALAAYRRETGPTHRAGALRELLRLRVAAPSHAAFGAALADLGCELAFDRPDAARELGEQLVGVLRELDEGGV